MGSGKELDVRALRKMYQGHKHLAEVLAAALAAGWTLREQGHGVRAYCPCKAHQLSLPKTPKAGDEQAARKAKRDMNSLCIEYRLS